LTAMTPPLNPNNHGTIGQRGKDKSSGGVTRIVLIFLTGTFLLAAGVWAAEEPIAVTVHTRNRQGYTFQTSITEDGRYVRRFRKDGGPDIADAPAIAEGALSEARREHLSEIVEHSGFFALDEDMTKKDLSTEAVLDRFEGELRVKRGSLEKTVRFGPNVESIPDGVSAVLNEVSRLVQEGR